MTKEYITGRSTATPAFYYSMTRNDGTAGMIGILLCIMSHDKVDLPQFFKKALATDGPTGRDPRSCKSSEHLLDSIQYSPGAFSPEGLYLYVSDFSPSNASARRLMYTYRIHIHLHARGRSFFTNFFYPSQFQVI